MRKLIWGGIRRHKGYAITTMVLSFLITLFVVVAVSTLFQANRQFEAAFERTGMPDIIVLLLEDQQKEAQETQKKLKENEEVANAVMLPMIRQEKGANFGKKKVKESFFIREIRREDKKAILTGDYSGKGIWLPVGYKKLYDVKAGDKMTFHLGSEKRSYTVAGFFEDPALGGDMTGIKQIWMSQEEYGQLSEDPQMDSFKGYALQVYMKQYRSGTFQESIRDLNKATGISAVGSLYMDRTLMTKAGMMVANIFLMMILAFSVLMILIAAIVMKYAIASSIESDFIQIGILNALGFTKGTLFLYEVMQVLLPYGIGVFLGLFASIAIAPAFGTFTMDGSGVLWSGGVKPWLMLAVTVILLMLAALLCMLSARKLLRLSSIQAIQKGHEEVAFRARINIPLEHLGFLPLQFRLACKSVLARWHQYVLLSVVSAVMIFALSSVASLKEHLSSADSLSQMFGYGQSSDLSIINHDESADKEFWTFVREMGKKYPVERQYSVENTYMMLDDMKVLIRVNDSFASDREALEGRYPKYDNEIIITKILGEMLGKDVGDWITVQNGSYKKRYLITGFNQASSDAGKMAELSEEAVKNVDPDFSFQSVGMELADDKDLKDIIRQMKEEAEEYGTEVEITNDVEEVEELMSGIQMGTAGMLALFYVLNIFLSGLIILMLAITMLKKQAGEYTVCHATGYRISQIRRQFAYCFGIMVLVGGLLGMAAHYLWSDRLFTVLFRQIGITEYHSGYSLLPVLWPILFTILFSVAFAYLASAGMKRLSLKDLQVE